MFLFSVLKKICIVTKQILCLFSQACGCPLYWKAPMFICAGGERTGFVSVHSFIATWRKWASVTFTTLLISKKCFNLNLYGILCHVILIYRLLHSCYDDASKFVYLLAKPGCSYLEQEDFIPLLQVGTLLNCFKLKIVCRIFYRASPTGYVLADTVFNLNL